MDAQIRECLAALKSRHIKGVFAENLDEGCQRILDLIPQDAVVGIGDSTGVRQMAVIARLNVRGTKLLNPYDPQANISDLAKYGEMRRRLLREATVCDVFLTGTNAITLDGRLVNMDANGNRTAGMFWGHSISIVTVGRNKIVKDLDEAFERVRKVIAPNHVRIRAVELGGRTRNTPCAQTGECSDCRSSDRICNILTVIEGKPASTDLNVILVDEDIGLGYDPSWPAARIRNILDNYKKLVWVPPNPASS